MRLILLTTALPDDRDDDDDGVGTCVFFSFVGEELIGGGEWGQGVSVSRILSSWGVGWRKFCW